MGFRIEVRAHVLATIEHGQASLELLPVQSAPLPGYPILPAMGEAGEGQRLASNGTSGRSHDTGR
jgi:hypothetical protein